MTFNRNEIYEKWQQYQNYIIIGVVSLVSLFFLPLIGSSIGLQFRIPDTWAGWIVYVVSKLLVAGLNVLIFHCFIQQAKINIKDNENYLRAQEILRKYSDSKSLAPRSPKKYLTGLYTKKGTTIFVTTIVAAVGLTQAILTFDWVSLLSYFFTVLFGVIFGILQMNQTEVYWTEEYLKYAEAVQREVEAKQNEETKETEQILECCEAVPEESLAVVTEEHI